MPMKGDNLGGPPYGVIEEAERLSTMKNLSQSAARDAELLGRFVDRQALADDEADGRPVQCCFHATVVLLVHWQAPRSTVNDDATGPAKPDSPTNT